MQTDSCAIFVQELEIFFALDCVLVDHQLVMQKRLDGWKGVWCEV